MKNLFLIKNWIYTLIQKIKFYHILFIIGFGMLLLVNIVGTYWHNITAIIIIISGIISYVSFKNKQATDELYISSKVKHQEFRMH